MSESSTKRESQVGLICRAPECDRPARSKGVCASHFNQLKSGVLKPLKRLGRKKIVNGNGYFMVYQPDHPATYRTKGYLLEHRLVMEQMIGRRLQPYENVHHVNGDRLDNRPENLELWSESQPSGQRIEDKVAWARELLMTYDATPEEDAHYW